MRHSKWPVIVITLFHIFSYGQTATNENTTFIVKENINQNVSSGDDLTRYAILQSGSEVEIQSKMLVDSNQSSSLPKSSRNIYETHTMPTTDVTDYTILSVPLSNEKVAEPSILDTSNDRIQPDSVLNSNSSPDKLSTFSEDKQENSSHTLLGNASTAQNTSKENLPRFSNIVPASPSSVPQTKENVDHSTLEESDSIYELSKSPPPEPTEDVELVSDSLKSHIQHIPHPRREGIISTFPSSINTAPQTVTAKHYESENGDFFNTYETTNPGPQENSPQSASEVHPPQVKIVLQQDEKLHNDSGVEYSVKPASKTEPNNSSQTIADPLPNRTEPKSLPDVRSSEPYIGSTPSYHPNDVIHVSPLETYASDNIRNVSSEEVHPCARPCQEGAPSMVCKYKFELEWYYTMSKACYDCPINLHDCDRKDCVVADGVRRPIVVINRQMPGPSIEVCKGDKILVDMENRMMEESTTIHWHGHHQRGTPYMDGVPYVTQCPIPPKSSFHYHYMADTPGTHFWHSHSGCQRADGVFGALIIRVPPSQNTHRNLYDYDLSEHVIQILDWDHKMGVDKFLAHHHANGNNKPITLLVNGRGRFHEFLDVESIPRNVSHSPTQIFSVKQGFRYRFRVINAGFLNCPIEMSVDNHTIMVISSDGTDLKPVWVDSLVTYAGERFDFILNANQKVGNYWMRFRGLMDCDERFTKAHQVAVLNYDGAPMYAEPPGEVSYEAARRKGLQVNSLNVGIGTDNSLVIPELEAVAEDDESLKEKPDMTFYLSYDFYEIDNPHYHRSSLYGFHQVPHKLQRLLTPQLNHISLRLPPFPLLSQHGNLGKKYPFCNESTVGDCENKYCECTHVIEVPLGAVLELVLIDKGKAFDANHPFHLHGHAFRVVAMERLNSSTTVEEVQRRDEAGLIHRKLKGAPIKDTITVPDGGFTIVRVHASNPGYWLFHCHIEFHVELGMALVFKVGQHKDFATAPPGFPQCNSYIPPDDEPDEQNSDVGNDVGAPVISITNWWPLRDDPQSSSSSLVLPNVILLLTLYVVCR